MFDAYKDIRVGGEGDDVYMLVDSSIDQELIDYLAERRVLSGVEKRAIEGTGGAVTLLHVTASKAEAQELVDDFGGSKD